MFVFFPKGDVHYMQEAYEIAFQGSKDDSTRFWTIFYLMSLVNGALFGIVVTSNAAAPLKMLVATLGLSICAIWAGIQRRMHYWCDWWDSKLEELEPEYMKKLQTPDVMLFRERKSNPALRPKGISTRTGGSLMPVVFGVGWFTLLASLLWILARQFCHCG